MVLGRVCPGFDVSDRIMTVKVGARTEISVTCTHSWAEVHNPVVSRLGTQREENGLNSTSGGLSLGLAST